MYVKKTERERDYKKGGLSMRQNRESVCITLEKLNFYNGFVLVHEKE